LLARGVHKADQPLAAEIRSMAVLPFQPLAGDDSQNYLGLGMADALITRLSNLRRVTVRPTSAVLKYSNAKDSVAAARELAVDVVVDGHIQRQGQNVRVTVQLLRVRDGVPLWAQTFDDYFTNIFQVQDSISEKIAAALSLRLSEPERRILTKRHTENTEAYQLYLQGRYFASKRTADGTLAAIDYYRKAAAKDPEYALPYAGLASSYITQAGVGMGAELRGEARVAAMRAINLDPELAEAHVALGEVLMRADWDWAGAGRTFDRAIATDANLATAHWAKSTLLTALGRHEDAIREMELASRLDPASAGLRSDLGWTYYCARRYEEAIQYSRKAVEMDPWAFTAHRELAKEYLVKAMHEEAIEEARKVLELVGSRRSRELADLGDAYAVAGRQAEARAILTELKERGRTENPPPSYAIAVLQARLGEKDAAFESLENACRHRLARGIWMKVDPELDSLRADPRFGELLRRVHLASE
jgi:TolB-like protein/tetratricopeptide (TPR) repeat protein